jgi:hypothetical protein
MSESLQIIIFPQMQSAFFNGLRCLDAWDLNQAESFFEEASSYLAVIKAESQAHDDESGANAACIVERYMKIWINFADFWKSIRADQFDTAWDCLQTARVDVNNLLRLMPANDSLDWLYRQLRYLDNAFGHSVFFSLEMDASKILCNICHNNYDSTDCPHLKGHLYNGEMAVNIIKQGTVRNVSLVGNPANRHCVVKVAGVTYQYPVLEAVRNRLISPFQSIRVLFPASRLFHIRSKIGRNDLCPCGSQKKFKKCCLDLWFTDSTQPHLDPTGDVIEYSKFAC